MLLRSFFSYFLWVVWASSVLYSPRFGSTEWFYQGFSTSGSKRCKGVHCVGLGESFDTAENEPPRSLRIATSYQAPFPRVRTTALLTSELMRTFSPFLNWARAWWYPLRSSSRTSRSPWTLPFRGPRPQEIEKDIKRPWEGPFPAGSRPSVVEGNAPFSAGCFRDLSTYSYLQALHTFAPPWPQNTPLTMFVKK